MRDAATLAVAVLSQVAKVIDKLSVEQLEALTRGDAQIAFVSGDTLITAATRKRASTTPRPSAKGPRLSADEVVRRLPELSDREEAKDYLEQSKLVVDELREVARRLNVTLPGKATKPVLIQKLVEGTVGYRLTHEAILGGAYRQ
jgi:hypothetical protein